MNRLTAALYGAAFSLSLLPGFALGQGAMQGYGSFTPQHLVMYAGQGQFIDAGGPTTAGGTPANNVNAGTLPSGLGIANSGQGLVLYSGYASGSYSFWKEGFDGSGNGLLTFGTVGGSTPTLTLSVNNLSQSLWFDTAGKPNVPTATTGDATTLAASTKFVASAISSSNTPQAWSAEVHQNGGGSCTGNITSTGAHQLCWSDQNIDLIADHLTTQTQDASMITYVTVGGSATPTDVVGLNWQVASVTYNIRYTVQSGDTTSTIASNLASCINAGGTTHCTVTSGFLAALLAFHDANGFGYKPTAGASGAKIAFDQPWASSGNSVSTSLSGGATETLTLTGGNILDNGPYMGTMRFVPGRTPVAGDQLGPFYFGGQSTANSGLDTQYASVIPRVLVQDNSNPQGELILATSDSGSAKLNNPKVYVGSGIVFADLAGANCGYAGLGWVRTCGVNYVSSTVVPQVQWESRGGAGDFGVTLNPGAAHNGYIEFMDGGVPTHYLKKDTSKNFMIVDANNGSVNAIEITQGGQVNLGESGNAVVMSGTLTLIAATWTDVQTCSIGQISVDANYIYVCTGTNTTKRVALSSF